MSRRCVALLIALSTAGLPATTVAQTAAPRLEGWNATYALPAGWRITQQQGRVHALAPATNDLLVYVVAGPYQTFDEVALELPKAFQLLGVTGMPASQPVASTVRQMRAMTADYMGQDRSGMPIQSRVIAVLSSQGSGVVVLGFARAGGATALAPALDAVVQGLEVTGPPVVNQQAVAALRGKWMAYSGRADGGSSVLGSTARSAEETVEFDGRGRFAYASSASVSVSTPGMGGMAGGASAANDQGTYTVIGTTLVVRGQRGMSALELQIQGDRIVADGKTYLRTN